VPRIAEDWSRLCIFKTPSIFGQPSWEVLAGAGAAEASSVARRTGERRI
jgi:hypothetical protein